MWRQWYGPYLSAGLLLHHLGEIGAEGIEHFGVREAELPVAHTPATYLREPLGMGAEIFGGRDELLERVHIHSFCPAEGSGETAVPDVFIAIANTDAMVQGVPVGIVLAVMGGIVPYLAVGKAGVVHLIDDGESRLDVGGYIGHLMVCHSVAFQLQKADSSVVDRLVLKAIDDCQPTVALEDETVIAYFVLAGEVLVGQSGLAYKDGGPQFAVIGIED